MESTIFTAGAAGATVDVADARVGLSICRDSMFPEHAVASAADGAGVWVNSSAWFAGGELRRELRHAALALDNGMVAVCGALVGPCGPFDFIGGSAIYGSDGRLPAHLGSSDGLAVVDE